MLKLTQLIFGMRRKVVIYDTEGAAIYTPNALMNVELYSTIGSFTFHLEETGRLSIRNVMFGLRASGYGEEYNYRDIQWRWATKYDIENHIYQKWVEENKVKRHSNN